MNTVIAICRVSKGMFSGHPMFTKKYSCNNVWLTNLRSIYVLSRNVRLLRGIYFFARSCERTNRWSRCHLSRGKRRRKEGPRPGACQQGEPDLCKFYAMMPDFIKSGFFFVFTFIKVNIIFLINVHITLKKLLLYLIHIYISVAFTLLVILQ